MMDSRQLEAASITLHDMEKEKKKGQEPLPRMRECQDTKDPLSAGFALNLDSVILDVQSSQPSLRQGCYSHDHSANIAKETPGTILKL